MKVYPQKKLHLVEKELNDNLGQDNFIFVGSSTDMWSQSIPREWIERIIAYCMVYPHNTYLYQTKNPLRYMEFCKPPKFVLGTTIETNREDLIKLYSKAPTIENRVYWMMQLPNLVRKMVTIEPIMDFDLFELVTIIKNIKPEWVNIGADSKGHNLPEPPKEKIFALIEELKKFTEVKIKNNLKRITGA